MSSQLSYSAHVKAIVAKAKARVGQLFPMLRLKYLPLSVVLRVFQVYILPILEYALPIWISGTLAKTAKQLINTVLTKFLKRYLGIPYDSNNSYTHFSCQTYPLFNILTNLANSRVYDVFLPSSLSGAKLTLVENTPPRIECHPNLEEIPSHFWRGRAISSIPKNPFYRRKVFSEIFDSNHYQNCFTKKFHKSAVDTCICTLCNNLNHPYHLLYFCDGHNTST